MNDQHPTTDPIRLTDIITHCNSSHNLKTMKKQQFNNSSNNFVARTAFMKRICCCSFHREVKDNGGPNIKEEHGERNFRSCISQPKILTREETKAFIHKRIIGSGGTQIKHFVDRVARSNNILIAESNIFEHIDDPLIFQERLHPEHKMFLDLFIIGSSWGGLLTCEKRLCTGGNYIIMIRDITSPSLNGLKKILLTGEGCKFAIKDLRLSKVQGIEELVNENHGMRCGMFSPPANGVNIKQEEED